MKSIFHHPDNKEIFHSNVLVGDPLSHFFIGKHIILNIKRRVCNFTPVLAFSHTGLSPSTHIAQFSCINGCAVQHRSPLQQLQGCLLGGKWSKAELQATLQQNARQSRQYSSNGSRPDCIICKKTQNTRALNRSAKIQKSHSKLTRLYHYTILHCLQWLRNRRSS